MTLVGLPRLEHLVLGIWDLFGIWNLGFGIYSAPGACIVNNRSHCNQKKKQALALAFIPFPMLNSTPG
jgi:hypothetical protein